MCLAIMIITIRSTTKIKNTNLKKERKTKKIWTPDCKYLVLKSY